MRGLFKTLIGDVRNLAVAASCVGVAVAILYSPFTPAAGLALPLALLAGAAYLAKH
jgi:hypothetical protein